MNLISQKFEYRHPVYLDDRIEVTVAVKEVLPKGKYVLNTECKNQIQEIVLTGESIVKCEK